MPQSRPKHVSSTPLGATGFPYISPISRHGHTDNREPPDFLPWAYGQPGATGFPYISPISRHGHTDKGRVERGIERELLSTQLYRIIQGFHKR